jgi:hypothetical protein
LRNSSTRCELLASRRSSTPSKDPHVEKEEYHPKCALSSRHSGLPFFVTVGGLLIAWRQVEINRRQIRLQFREKRLAVYEAAMTLIARAVKKGNVTQEEWQKFARDTKEVAFLFDRKIDEYCREIYNHAVDVSVSHYVMGTAPSSPEL